MSLSLLRFVNHHAACDQATAGDLSGLPEICRRRRPKHRTRRRHGPTGNIQPCLSRSTWLGREGSNLAIIRCCTRTFPFQPARLIPSLIPKPRPHAPLALKRQSRADKERHGRREASRPDPCRRPGLPCRFPKSRIWLPSGSRKTRSMVKPPNKAKITIAAFG